MDKDVDTDIERLRAILDGWARKHAEDRGDFQECFAARNKLLQEMGFRDYGEYLKSDLWRKIRAANIKKKCYCCDAAGDHHLHHRSYTLKNLIGVEISEGDFATLCSSCHRLVHRDPFDNFVSLDCCDERMEALRDLWKTKKQQPSLADLVLLLPSAF